MIKKILFFIVLIKVFYYSTSAYHYADIIPMSKKPIQTKEETGKKIVNRYFETITKTHIKKLRSKDRLKKMIVVK